MEEINYSKLTKVSSADNKTELHQCRENPVIAKEYVDKNYVEKSKLKEILYEDYGEDRYDYYSAYQELVEKIENLL